MHRQGFRVLLAAIICFTVINLASIGALHAEDSAVSEQIRERIERLHDTRSHARQLKDLTMTEAVSQFYEYRQFKPAWTDRGHVEALLGQLGALRDDGLDPEDYQLAELRERFNQLLVLTADPTAQADFDLMASQSYLRALAHLFRGKVDPKKLDAQWNFALHDITSTAAFGIVSAAVDNGDLASAFAQARPQHRLYKNARDALAKLREIDTLGGWPTLAATPTLKPGMQDPQVPLLRQRLALAGYLPVDHTAGELYDDELAEAVKQFQREQYLEDDGAIGAATRNALNVPVSARIDQVRVNLERGRWQLHDIADTTVIVDVAGFKVYYLRNGKPVWQSSVQVGKPYRSTPIFKSNITYITVNPTWTVPPTILKNDVLPKVRRDIGYLARNNMRVLDASGRELSPADVNWNKPGNVVLRQDAGAHNSLGQVVIRFPNPYAVYMHDTPHQELFGSSARAFSSGCIRVERPLELVELVMNDAQKWNRSEIEARIAEGKTRNFNVATPVPLLLAYWTVDVLDPKRLAFKADIYQRDPPLLKALNKRI